ncbi:MAG: hypothetical protein R3240_12570 [Gammaproteobacteria bacterium]|nr:hypothetical protein [Gammaproteobacteria bacterium]
MINRNKFLFSIKKSLKSITSVLPIIIGMLLLTSLLINLFSAETITQWFGKQEFFDVLIGAGVGSIAAGPPLLSYTLGGELLTHGISLFAVTALIVSWVTVGIVQLPMEMAMLGRRFALYRNISSFVLAIFVSFVTVYTVQLVN